MKTTLEESLQGFQSPKIRAIVERSAISFVNLMSHKESELVETMQEIEEGKTLSIGHALILDIGKNQQKDRVSFSVKHQIERDGEIPDPDQADLPLGEDGEEVSS
jgi:hypothetical protein